MSDNFSFTPGTGKTGAAKEINSVLYPQVIATESDGTDTALAAKLGSLTETAPASDTASAGINGRLQRIAQRLTTLIASTIAVSAASLPLPSGAATSAKQDTGNTSVASIDTKTPSLGQALAAASTPVVLTAAQITTLTPPPAITGFATEATLGGVLTTSDFDSKAGSLTETAPASDTASSGLNGRLQRVAQRLTSLLAVFPTTIDTNSGSKSASTLRVVLATDQPALTNKLLVTPDSVALPANQSVNISQINGVTTATGTGIMGTGVQRVAIASDNDALTVKQATGTNLHIVVDSGTVTTVSTVTNLSQLGGTAIAMNTGTRSTGTQRVTIATDDVVPASQSGTWTVQPGNTANTTAWKVDGSAVTQPVSLASVPSHAVTNAGTFAVQSADDGDVAHDGADSGNPVKVGGKATNVEPTAVSASGDRTNFITDMVGKQITLPYSNPENFVSGAITSAMTGTTSTSLVAAPASGLRNYITTIIVSNAHATVGTDIIIQDGSGGTTLLTIPAAAVYGGAVITLPVPLRQPTTATAIYCANVTTGASTKVSAVGYKGV
jgi:hypothetical protein